jgi:hypothetical protein
MYGIYGTYNIASTRSVVHAILHISNRGSSSRGITGIYRIYRIYHVFAFPDEVRGDRHGMYRIGYDIRSYAARESKMVTHWSTNPCTTSGGIATSFASTLSLSVPFQVVARKNLHDVVSYYIDQRRAMGGTHGPGSVLFNDMKKSLSSSTTSPTPFLCTRSRCVSPMPSPEYHGPIQGGGGLGKC